MKELFARIENCKVVALEDEYSDGCVKVTEMVKVGWTYDSITCCCYPPTAPEGFAYDWETDCFIPYTEEALQVQSTELENYQNKMRYISEPYVEEGIDNYTLKLIEEGVL